MRDRINEAVKTAMRSGDKARLGTLRLMTAALKDRELGIGPGAPAGGGALGETEIVAVLQRMVKQRRDSIATYVQGGRQDLADKEAAEIVVIEEFLPRQMGEAEMKAAIAKLLADEKLAGFKDMGRAMALLKARFTGQMDFGKASAMVKALLS